MERFTRQGLVFEVRDSGPRDGEAVVLLHGWPQDASAWDRVVPQLNAAGLRTLAPDQRGCSPAARPRRHAAYVMAELVADVVALLDAAGVDRAHVVGHDWGGALAWALAERRPERVRSLTVLSTPHPRAMAWALRHADQARRSWYMVAFQVPWLPERYLRPRLEGLLRSIGCPEEQAQRYAARFREPGAARGGLNWYRALGPASEAAKVARKALRRKVGRPTTDPAGAPVPRRISVPTTFVWGNRDPALGRAAAERTERWVVSDYRFVELDAGHWLPETRPEEVARAVLARAGLDAGPASSGAGTEVRDERL